MRVFTFFTYASDCTIKSCSTRKTLNSGPHYNYNYYNYILGPTEVGRCDLKLQQALSFLLKCISFEDAINGLVSVGNTIPALN